MEKPPVMDRYTFGNSKAAQNLIVDILQKPEYILYSKRVARLLSKQRANFDMVNLIPNEIIRKATLRMWHERFANLCSDLPQVVKTHTLCVETGWYRQFLKLDMENNSELMIFLKKYKCDGLIQQARQETAREIWEAINKRENPFFMRQVGLSPEDVVTDEPQASVWEDCQQDILRVISKFLREGKWERIFSPCLENDGRRKTDRL